jgi:hypothetical protein
MRKRDELTNPASCMNRAKDDEWTFVLLGRDAAAPVAVRAWIDERIRLGKNTPGDAQIVEAMHWIKSVEIVKELETVAAKKVWFVVDYNEDRLPEIAGPYEHEETAEAVRQQMELDPRYGERMPAVRWKEVK